VRLVASIKLKHTTASTLLKRLNSYSQQHPLYQAIKEFGKVVRILFLLRYMDDEMQGKESISKITKPKTHTNLPEQSSMPTMEKSTLLLVKNISSPMPVSF
jgi:hypothetical protein